MQARLFDEPQLAALCLECIDKNTPEALTADGFTDIDIDTLSAVLDRDSLRIKENKLFAAVLRWSEAECQRQSLPVTVENKRSVLGRGLYQIRFPLMTVEEFAQGPAQSGILTDRETVSLFLHFTVNPKPPVGFLDVPRCSMTGKEQTVCRRVDEISISVFAMYPLCHYYLFVDSNRLRVGGATAEHQIRSDSLWTEEYLWWDLACTAASTVPVNMMSPSR